MTTNNSNNQFFSMELKDNTNINNHNSNMNSNNNSNNNVNSNTNIDKIEAQSYLSTISSVMTFERLKELFVNYKYYILILVVILVLIIMYYIYKRYENKLNITSFFKTEEINDKEETKSKELYKNNKEEVEVEINMDEEEEEKICENGVCRVNPDSKLKKKKGDKKELKRDNEDENNEKVYKENKSKTDDIFPEENDVNLIDNKII